MPRHRRRQTLPALVVGSIAEAVLRAREKHSSRARSKNELGEVVAPVPPLRRRPKPERRAPKPQRPQPRKAADQRPRTKSRERLSAPGQTQSRIVVLFIVLALGVPFFTMSGVRPAVAAGTISYDGHIGTGAELYGDCPGGATQTVSATDDTQIIENQPSQTSGPAAVMEVESSTAGARKRSLVRFNLPPIPSGCFLSGAELRMPVTGHTKHRTLLATRAATAWSESTTNWTTQPAPVGSSASTGSGPNTVAWTVRSQVEAMYAGTNHGFIIQDANDTSGSAKQQFQTKEGGLGPQLVLDFGTGYGTSVTINTTDSVPAGNSVVVSFAMADAAGAVSASDTAGNVYSVDADASYTGGVRSVVLSAHDMEPLPAGGAITITHPSTGSRAASANQFAGLAGTGALDGSNAAAGFSTAPSTGAVTTTTADSLLVGAFGISGEATFSAGGGFTPMPGLVAQGQGQLATQYMIATATGSYTSSGTLSASSPWAGGIAAYKMDTTVPIVEVTTPEDNSLTTPTPTFSGTSATGNSDSETITLKLYDGTGVSGPLLETIPVTRADDGTWSFDHTSPLGDGVYTIQAEQSDGAQNQGLSTPATFTVDTLVPEAPSVTSPSPDPGNDNTVSWSFLGEPGGTYECRLTSGTDVIDPYGPCTSPAEYVLTNGDGIYTFSVRQMDEAGNVGAEATDDYVLDTQTPADPEITGPEPDPSNNNQGLWTFTSEPGATTDCRLMKGVDIVSPWAPCTSPAEYALVDGDGTYTFSVRQTDRAGNASGVVSDDYTLDTVVPTTTIETGPSGLTNDPNIEFSFSSDDPTASFECSLDNSGFTPCSSPTTYTSLGDGEHTFEVRALDDAGNIDASPGAQTFTLDTGAPPLSIDQAPKDPGKDATVTWGFSSEPGATITCEVSLEGVVVSPSSDCSGGSATYDLGADGLYTFSVRAIDSAGNSSTASDTYHLDTGQPTSVASSTPLTSSPSITVAYGHDDAGSGVSEVELWVNAPGSGSYVLAGTDTSVSGAFTYTATAGSGAYKFYTRARDAAGNYEGAPGGFDTQTVLDTDAPNVILETAPSDPTSEGVLTFTFSTSDPTATFACSFTSDGTDAYVPCTSPASYTSPDVTTAYTFKVVATDNVGNVGPAETWSFMYVEPEPEPTPTETITPEPTPTETITPEPTPTETVTPEPTPTETITPEPTPTETVTPDPTPTKTVTPDPTPTETFTPEPPEPPEPTQAPTEEPPATQPPPPPSGGGGGTVVRVDQPNEPNLPPEPVKPEKKAEPKPEPKPEPRRNPIFNIDNGFLPQDSSNTPINRLGELAEFAAEAVKTFAFPLLLAILVIVFLLVQHWIDKKDPKLAMAPVHSNHDLAKFK